MKQEPPFRPYHYLPVNLSTSAPSQLIFVDSETLPHPVPGRPTMTHHKLRLWCASSMRLEDGQRTRVELKTGTTQESFWDFVFPRLSHHRPTYLFAHQLGFDLTILGFWRLLDDGKLTVKDESQRTPMGRTRKKKQPWAGFVCLEDPPTIIKCRMKGKRRTLVCLDTLNYWRMPLAELGQSIGIPKWDMPAFGESDETWETYCWNDVAVIQAAILGLIDLVREDDLGHFKWTAPGQAMAAFKHRFMPAKSIVIHGHKSAVDLERAGYYGGRVEQFFVGKVKPLPADRSWHRSKDERNHWVEFGPVYALDVQSHYANVMATNQFPRRLIDYDRDVPLSYFSARRPAANSVAAVRLDSPGEAYPFRNEKGTIMAVGRFDTALSGPELYKAVCQGVVKKVWEVATYDMADLFSEYVRHFWERRQAYKAEGNIAFASMAKMLLNSLQGKFAQKEVHWLDCPGQHAIKPWGPWVEQIAGEGKPESWRSIAWLAQRKTDGGEYKDSFPAIPAFVTSYGRLAMTRLFNLAGVENCLYSDTDSIHVLPPGLERLERGGAVQDGVLGALSVRGVYESAEYRGPKDYTLNGRHIVAGIKRHARELAPGLYEQEEFSNLAAVLAGQPVDYITVETKVLRRQGPANPIKVDEFGRVLPIERRDW